MYDSFALLFLTLETVENGTTSSGTQEISSDGSIDLIASIVPTNPMPMLHWLKENDTIATTDSPSGFQSSILDTGKYIVLSSSDNGTVGYYKPEVNSSDSGTYVAMATYGDYYQIISTIEIIIGKLSSTQLQGGHGTGKTGKTGNLVLTFSRQGKHREFCFDTGKKFETQGKYFSVTQGKI